MKISMSLLATAWISIATAGVFGEEEVRSPEVAIGARLFLETRFAQAFFAQSGSNVNATDISGDPVMNTSETTHGPLPGPFAGKTMNCRACHMESELKNVPGGGVRTYADFARRSPIPLREDGKTMTVRNSPALVNATLPGPSMFLHFDAEFTTPEGLVLGGFTGRNFGWLAREQPQAIKHIARVIRDDDGTGELAKQFGGAYAKVFAGDPSVPPEFLLPKEFRLDVTHASDKKILAAVGKLVGVYLKSLTFSSDEMGNYNGSPYDLFLRKNNLPLKPDTSESRLDYSRRLRDLVNALSNPLFVSPDDGHLETHQVPFVFGPDELAGLKIFLAEPPPRQDPPAGNPPRLDAGPRPGIGNCIGCHTAPEFTDFRFHNTGVTQLEYDALHGDGAFANLKIPSLVERRKNPADSFPASPKHPDYSGRFRSIATPDNPERTDLGLWNVFGNPDVPMPQRSLQQVLRNEFGRLTAAETLARTVAIFKTPGLRDLGHSQPYQHNGSLDTLQAVVAFYARVGNVARAGLIRNADPRLAGIGYSPEQGAQLAKFLNSLNEDFED